MIKSRSNKLWLLPEEDPSEDLKAFCNNELVAQVLNARQVKTSSEALYYFGSHRPAFTDAHEIPQLEKAVARIEKAIKDQEKIVVYGDYDVDGTTSTALMITTLQTLGGNASFYIPNRFSEGYGLNSKAVVTIKSKQKANLLITCDCGITNIEEVKLAQSIGLDTIITDHHSLPEELPPAIAVLNPKLLSSHHPLHWLPGVGVVYKLAEVLLARAGLEQEIQPLLDLVALGMIADLAPLRAENRLLVQDGLKILNNTQRVGLKALLSECGYQADEEGIGFMLAPRINAAGRLNDANLAVNLFLAQNLGEAQILAKTLSEQNKSRQGLCDETYVQALEKIEKEIDLKNNKAILLADKRWHHGVVGIVASRLVEKFHLPVFLAVEEDDETIKGSARGISSLDLFVEMSKHGHLFKRFGGHKAAAGFSLSKNNWQIFREALQDELQKTLKPKDLQATLGIDAAISFKDLDFAQLEPVWNLAPFGMGFSKPIFTLQQEAEIVDLMPLGKDAEHTKLILRQNQKNLEAVQWRIAPQEFSEAKKIGKIKIAFSPNKRTFNGNTFLQLEIKDWIIEKTNQIEIKAPQILDYRFEKQSIEKIQEFCSPNSLIFAEGESLKQLESLKQFENLKANFIDRTNNSPMACKQLIFWSLPIQTEIIQKLVSKYSPQEIIIFGLNLKKEINLKDFLKQFLNLIKKEIKPQENVCFKLSSLGSLLEAREKTCLAALNLLQESGILSFKFSGEEVKIMLFNSPNKVQLNVQSLQSSLLEEQELKHKLLNLQCYKI